MATELTWATHKGALHQHPYYAAHFLTGQFVVSRTNGFWAGARMRLNPIGLRIEDYERVTTGCATAEEAKLLCEAVHALTEEAS